MQQDLVVRSQLSELLEVPGRGKGRIRARKTAAGPPSTDVVKLNSRPTQRKTRYAAFLEGEELCSFDLGKPAEAKASWEAVRQDEAFKMVVCPFVQQLGAVGAPSVLGMCHVKQGCAVFAATGALARVLEADGSKNNYGQEYFIRETETQALSIDCPEAQQSLLSWTSRKLFCRATLLEEFITDLAGTLAPASTQQTSDRPQKHLDWHWLQEFQAVHRLGSVVSCHVESGSCGMLLPARYSVKDRLIVQAVGQCHMLLLPPEAAFKGLYPYPIHHPYDCYAMPDLEAPDTAKWTGLESVRGKTVTLEAGSALFVPAYWFVHAELQGDVAPTSLSVLFERGRRLRSKAATAIQLSRLVEDQVGALVGPSKLRTTLLAMAEDKDATYLDVGTVAGYQKAVIFQEMRDEIDESLGAQSSDRQLTSICQNRLQPTPWLNQVFREPLYLTDAPRYYLDDRTEEECKYPELFRQQILRKQEARTPLPNQDRLRAAQQLPLRALPAPA